MSIPQIQIYVEWLSFACMIPFLGGLLIYNKAGKSERIFVWYLAYEILKQLFLLLNIRYFHINTLFITHVSSVVVPIVFMFVLIPRKYYEVHKLLFWVFVLSVGLYYFMDISFDVTLMRFNVNTAILSSGIVVVCGLIRLYDISQVSRIEVVNMPIFWIAAFSIVYYATNIYFYNERQLFLEAKDWQNLAEIQFYNMIAYSAIYMLPIGYGFFRIKYTQKC